MNARHFCFSLPLSPGGAAFLFLLLAPVMHGATNTPVAAPDTLGEVLPILQSSYVDFAQLQAKPSDQLSDLLTRSQGQISITATVAPTVDSTVRAILLPDGTVYCRFASFSPPAGWDPFATQLKTWMAQEAQGVILDLRNTATPEDFDGAARVAGLFTTAGTPLFTIRKAGGDVHAYVSVSPATGVNSAPIAGPVAVLINGGTTGAAEALAACLQANGALTLGRWTSGNGAEFAEHPLASGRVLHYVAGDVTMADGTPLWRHSVQPDIGLLVDHKKEELVLGLIAQDKILDVIQESSGSHRLSEAALVRGEDPGVEAYLLPHEKTMTPQTPQDSTLVAALDSLKAIRVSQEAPAAAAVEEPKIPSMVQ